MLLALLRGNKAAAGSPPPSMYLSSPAFITALNPVCCVTNWADKSRYSLEWLGDSLHITEFCELCNKCIIKIKPRASPGTL